MVTLRKVYLRLGRVNVMISIAISSKFLKLLLTVVFTCFVFYIHYRLAKNPHRDIPKSLHRYFHEHDIRDRFYMNYVTWKRNLTVSGRKKPNSAIDYLKNYQHLAQTLNKEVKAGVTTREVGDKLLKDIRDQ